MNNFATPVNEETISGDYLSIFTKNFGDSPYNVTVILTATLPESAFI
jgi:hypothetical protein